MFYQTKKSHFKRYCLINKDQIQGLDRGKGIKKAAVDEPESQKETRLTKAQTGCDDVTHCCTASRWNHGSKLFE